MTMYDLCEGDEEELLMREVQSGQQALLPVLARPASIRIERRLYATIVRDVLPQSLLPPNLA